MRLKLDENIPRRVERFLAESGHDCSTVVQEGLAGASDTRVASAATAEDRMLVTLDRGFGDLRAYSPGSHPGIVVLHVTDQGPGLLAELVETMLSEHHLDSFKGCVAIAERGRVRVRRPLEAH